MKYCFSIFILLLFSCQEALDQKVEIQQLQLQLLEKQKEIEFLKIPKDRYLVHLVYFDLKPEANKKVFVEALKNLGDIPSVNDLEVGHFKDLSDKRALSDFEIMMQMSFDSEKDYTTYQNHPIHLKLKSLAAKFVSAPPATYDYLLAD